MRHAKKRAAVLLTLSLLAVGLLAASPAMAQEFQIVDKCVKELEAQGKAPSLECALKTFGNVAQLILGITGSVALLMFVYGGFLLLASGGSEEKITKGKEVIRNAVIGIVIIMTSGLLIRYGLSQLDVKYAGAPCVLDDGRTGEYAATNVNGKETFSCQAVVRPQGGTNR